MANKSPEVLEKVRKLPPEPGVYRFLDKQRKIIYIGKAKNLKKRVSSYFNSGRQHSYRIRRLVESIEDLAYTITNSEVEALLLENNLIKTHQPRYNILLKDGKTYPYICIKNERFPRVFSTRRKINDGSLYFGPYPSVSTLNALLELIHGFVKLRTCNYHLSERNIQAGKFKVCLEYQIDNCAGPCEGLFDEESYMEGITQVKHLLRGNLGTVLKHLEGQMKQAASDYKFEQAESIKKKYEQINAYRQRNRVVQDKINDLEVLTVAYEQHIAMVNHFKLQNGAIIQTHSWEIKRQNEEEKSELIQAALAYLIVEEEDLFEEIVVNEIPSEAEAFVGKKFTVPQKGDKRHLVELSLKNCYGLLKEKLYDQTFKKRKTAGEVMMEELQAALNMIDPPDHIECIDNSNFQGSQPVAAVVVFKNGKPSKRDYRHFNIKTVEGPNDFASMEEVVHRRYKRLKEEEQPLPKLLVIDGGKGQLGSAAKSLKELGLLETIPVIGIAKRLEEIYMVGDPIPLHLDKKSAGLQLLQQLRNEAHRFAITFHRNKRSKDSRHRSKLSSIKGIGSNTEQKILSTFKSIKKLKAASETELEAKLGKSKAKIILDAIEEGKL